MKEKLVLWRIKGQPVGTPFRFATITRTMGTLLEVYIDPLTAVKGSPTGFKWYENKEIDVTIVR